MLVLAVQMDFSQTTFKDRLRVHRKPAYQRQNKDYYKDNPELNFAKFSSFLSSFKI